MARVLVDGSGTNDGWRFTEEAVLNTSFTLSYVTQASQTVPVIFNIGSFPRRLPLLDTYAGYLVLKRLVLIINRSILLSQPQPIGAFDTNTYLVPNGGGTFTEWFIHNSLRTILSVPALPSGVTISSIKVGNHGGTLHPTHGIYYAANAGLLGFAIDLAGLYSPTLGFVNPQPLSTYVPFGVAPPNQGVDFQIGFGNTSGSTQSVSIDYLGSDLAFDNAKFTLEFADATGFHHNIGVYDDSINPSIYQMDLLIPLALNDPGQTNFGNLVFTLLSAYSVYNTSYTVNVMLTTSMAYLSDQ